MDADVILRSATLLASMLNPFLTTVFLMPLVQSMGLGGYARVVASAGMISAGVFAFCALTGEAFFTQVLQVRFAAFLIFGGIVILGVTLRFIFAGADSLQDLRGPADRLPGTIAMPFMVGPGTISASMLAGSRMPLPAAFLAIFAGLTFVVVALVALKALHDWVRKANEERVTRWVDVTGRLMALVMGTYAVDLILRGIDAWLISR